MKKLGIQTTALFLLLTLGGLFSTPTLFAQSRQVSKLLKAADASANLDNAHMLHFDAQWLAEELGDDTGLAEAQFRHALYYRSLGNSSLGDYFLELSMDFYRSQENQDKLVEIQWEYDLQELGSQKAWKNQEILVPPLNKQTNHQEVIVKIEEDLESVWKIETDVIASQEKQLSITQIVAGFIMILSLLAVVYFRQQWKKTLDEKKV